MAVIIYDHNAKIEIKEAAAYYEKCQENLGKKFLEIIEDSVGNISKNPLIYRTLRGEFRRCLVKKFPCGISYLPGNEIIFIAAVMHLKRKPDYWYQRVNGKKFPSAS